MSTLEVASHGAQRQFLRHMDDYLSGVCQQADDRDSSRNRSIEGYFAVRRLDIGVMPCFSMLLIGHDVPDEVITNPKITLLESLAVDLILYLNVNAFLF